VYIAEMVKRADTTGAGRNNRTRIW